MNDVEFRTTDLVLPILAAQGRLGIRNDGCPVKIVLTDTDVKLYVGPRDWQWNRETGQLVGAGTGLMCDVWEKDSQKEEAHER